MQFGQYTATCILAEFVRPEPRARHTIVGTYASTLHLREVPAVVPVGVYVRITPAPETGTPVRMVLKLGDNTMSDDTMPSPERKEDIEFQAANICLNGMLLEIHEETSLRVLMAIGNTAEPVVIDELNVRVRQRNDPAVSP